MENSKENKYTAVQSSGFKSMYMRAELSLGEISSPLADSNLQVSGDHDLSRLKDMRRGNDLTAKIVFVGRLCGLPFGLK